MGLPPDVLDCATVRSEVPRREAGDVEYHTTQPFRVIGVRAHFEPEAVREAQIPPCWEIVFGDRIRQPMPVMRLKDPLILYMKNIL